MNRHAVAMAVMVGGSATVFMSMVLMNDHKGLQKAPVERSTSQFEVVAKPPKKKPQRREPPKNRKTSSNAPRPPMPSLGSSIGTLNLGLPGLDVSSVSARGNALLSDVKASVMTEDSVDSKPKARRRPAAAYPARARAQGISGQVTLNILIGTDGRVEKVKVLESTPSGVFEQTAIDAIRAWEFEPAIYQGKPVKVWAHQTIRFDLT